MKTKKEISTNILLAEFCKRHNISRAKLSEIAGGSANEATKSSIQRFLHDQIEDTEYNARLRKVIAENLPDYLISMGLSSSEIDHELQQIFDKGEYQPMINQRKKLSPEVAKFFSLFDANGKPTDPFSQPPRNRQEAFISPALKQIADSVIDAIKFQGFIYISGEIGAGKTVLRSLIEDMTLNDSSLHLVCPESSNMSKISSASIERLILSDFGVEKIPIDPAQRFRAVKKLLAGQFSSGVRVGISFDEVHRADKDTVSSFKNLLEMSSGGFQRYLGVILFGQPHFETRLTSLEEKRDFREIYERLTVLKMPEFKDSALDYLTHRLKLVGANVNDLFDAEAIDLIVRQSKTPLQLGNIVNQALILSKETFKIGMVKGAAIKTKMHFSEK